MNKLIGLGGLSVALVLQACGSGDSAAGGQQPPPPPPPEAKAGGLWLGTLQSDGLDDSVQAVAMIAEDGRARFVSIESDATLESRFAISSATFEGYGWYYVGFLDDDASMPSGHNIYLTGAVAERQSLTMTWSEGFATGQLQFVYDPDLYEVPSSLEEIAGTWTGFDDDNEPWITLTIDADGQFAADVANGCNPTGRFAIIDERFNLYDVEDVVFDCAADSTFSGFAYAVGDNVSAPGLFVSLDNGTEALRLQAMKD